MNNLEFLDILTLISFVLQLQNQQNIIGISDVQREVNRAVEDIHQHLQAQDEKLERILNYEADKKAVLTYRRRNR